MDDAPPPPQPPTASPPQSTHRLPTLTAARALAAQRAEDDVEMGVKGLDKLVGLRRGEVTEVYGAPGVGKRAFGLQFAVAALRRGERVCWVDAGTPLPGPRLQTVLAASLTTPPSQSSQAPTSSSPTTHLKNLTLFTPPTLPHLLALLSTPPPKPTTLLILSSPSSLLPPPPLSQTTTSPRPNTSLSTHLITSLRRLAATSHIALLILSQTGTQMQHLAPAVLVPAIGGAAWEGGVAKRVVLWREMGGRYVRVVKGGRGEVGAFVVSKNGIADAPVMEWVGVGGGNGRKRKATEILDSERRVELGDEDYGWDEGDEVGLPLLGPQTQGSEDILVVPEEEETETETEGEEGWEGGGSLPGREGTGGSEMHEEEEEEAPSEV